MLAQPADKNFFHPSFPQHLQPYYFIGLQTLWPMDEFCGIPTFRRALGGIAHALSQHYSCTESENREVSCCWENKYIKFDSKLSSSIRLLHLLLLLLLLYSVTDGGLAMGYRDLKFPICSLKLSPDC